MAVDILREARQIYRDEAYEFAMQHHSIIGVGVRAQNKLRQAARLTVAIVQLKKRGM